MGMTSLNEIHAWCEKNDGVVDIPLPKAHTRADAPTQVRIDPATVVPNVPDNTMGTAAVEEKPVEKKTKQYSKKEESDPSSGIH